mmetsp:Transcript_5056/g.11947  ORF Transcript_5056/g.11947 Transcript_5056/m.11947 type:complete len:260 (-) Transcript_5056:482-1261(-)
MNLFFLPAELFQQIFHWHSLSVRSPAALCILCQECHSVGPCHLSLGWVLLQQSFCGRRARIARVAALSLHIPALPECLHGTCTLLTANRANAFGSLTKIPARLTQGDPARVPSGQHETRALRINTLLCAHAGPLFLRASAMDSLDLFDSAVLAGLPKANILDVLLVEYELGHREGCQVAGLLHTGEPAAAQRLDGASGTPREAHAASWAVVPLDIRVVHRHPHHSPLHEAAGAGKLRLICAGATKVQSAGVAAAASLLG